MMTDDSIRSIAVRFGHITRRLNAKEPLKGKTLVLALQVLDRALISGDKTFLGRIREKIATGQELDDDELFMMVESILPISRFNTYGEL